MANNRLTSSPWGFRLTPLDEQCRMLKQLGIEYICGQVFEDLPGTYHDDVTEADMDKGYEIVSSHGLKYASFNAGGDFMVYEGLDKEVALACRHIDLATRVKPEVIIIFAGWVDRDDDAVYGQVAEGLKAVCKHAAGYNLPVALENHGGLTTHAEQVNRIIKGVDEPNIGLNYDPANFEMHGEDAYKSLCEIDVPIIFTHFKSLKVVDGQKEYCRLSEGTIDYLPIMKKLDDMAYGGFHGLEYEETDDAFEGTQDDKKFLMDVLGRI